MPREAVPAGIGRLRRTFNLFRFTGEAPLAACCESCSTPQDVLRDGYWKALVWALVLNALMFVVELSGALKSDSVSLLADAVDFLGDAFNYGASLAVLGLALVWRSRLALVKGTVMGLWGVAVLARSLWLLFSSSVPDASMMTVVGFMALGTNLGVAILLWKYRSGDSNQRAVWLCTRNDALANVAVLAASQAVSWTGQGWPDVLAAVGIAGLGVTGGWSVIRQARSELRDS
ncbi:MAG: cation transporter [Fibrobacteria bacterium]|nr:cation transporter [Fibrobacteria bacterium]